MEFLREFFPLLFIWLKLPCVLHIEHSVSMDHTVVSISQQHQSDYLDTFVVFQYTGHIPLFWTQLNLHYMYLNIASFLQIVKKRKIAIFKAQNKIPEAIDELNKYLKL